jgi:hypothetical protein
MLATPRATARINVEAPSKLARLLARLNGLAASLGLDLIRVDPAPPSGDRQLELANEILRRVQDDPEVSFVGRLMTRQWYRKIRSWPQKVLSLPPHHNDHPILFISGIPRSGTTFANDLLAADEGFRILRHADLDLDLRQARRALRLLFRDGDASVDAVHPLASPPEDLQIMGQYVLADLLMGVYGAEYLMEMPEAFQHRLFEHGYRFEREVYRRLPIEPHQRFVIKSPIIHMMYFAQFQQAFDRYRMLLLVRDVPVAVLSSCHIFEVGMRYLKRIDPARIGPLFLRYLEGYVRGLEHLTPAELDRFLFLDFERFVREPLAVLERVYPWLGLELTEAARRRYRDRQPQLERVHISHVRKPSASYYNLDLDAVRDLARRYAAIYGPRLW